MKKLMDERAEVDLHRLALRIWEQGGVHSRFTCLLHLPALATVVASAHSVPLGARVASRSRMSPHPDGGAVLPVH